MELGDGMKRNARLAIYGTAATRIRASGFICWGTNNIEVSTRGKLHDRILLVVSAKPRFA